MSTLKTHNLQSPDAGSVNIALAPNAGMVVTGISTFSNDIVIPDKIVHTGDTDTAIRFSGADTIQLETGGAARLTLSGGNIVQQSGTLYIKNATGDSNGLKISQESSDESRIFNHYSGPLTFGTANTERLRIGSNGYVNIGTGTAEEQLTIRNTSQHCLIRIISGNASGVSAGIDFGDADDSDVGRIRYYHDNNYMRFDTSAGERMRINSSGNVQIGTAADPGNALRYVDIGNYNTGSSAGSILRLITRESDGTDSASADIVKYKAGGLVINNNEKLGTAGFISFGTATGGGSTTERLRIDSNGNIGAGTGSSTIDEALSVERAGNVTIMAECSASGSGANAAIRLKSADSSSDWYMQTGNAVSGGLRFYSGSEKLRINSGTVWVNANGMPSSSSGAKLQLGAHTFTGGHFAYANSRLGIQNNGSLTCIANCSTYADATYPGYGLIMVQGASTSDYNTFGICPDSPQTGSDLNFHTGYNKTNIHSDANVRQMWINMSGQVYKRDNGANWNQTSDERLKKNIVDNNIGLAEIKQLRITSFEYRKADEIDISLFPKADNPLQVIIEGEEGPHTGVIAQEIESVIPECVKTSDKGTKTVQADAITWALVNAVKELSAKNDALEERIKNLEGS